MSIFGLMVELVTGLVFDEDGNATCKGADDHELDPTVGYHFGFYSRPRDGARGVVVKADGQGNTAILFAFRDKQYELSLEKGEAGMKNAFDAWILLDKDGKIRADASEIQLGDGASEQVARKDDNLTAGAAPAAWALILETFVNGLVPGTFTALNQWTGSGPGNPGASGALGTINQGSSVVKAVD